MWFLWSCNGRTLWCIWSFIDEKVIRFHGHLQVFFKTIQQIIKLQWGDGPWTYSSYTAPKWNPIQWKRKETSAELLSEFTEHYFFKVSSRFIFHTYTYMYISFYLYVTLISGVFWRIIWPHECHSANHLRMPGAIRYRWN